MEVFRDGFFADLVLVITGGGTGIGYEIACQAAALGAKGIAICGRRAEPLSQAKEQLERIYKTRIFTSQCDIREADSVDSFVDAVLQEFGKIDILINNAGGQFPINAESLTTKGFEAVIRNNLTGTWNMTRAVAKKAFIPHNGGSIVNVIAQIRNGFPGMVHTGAARAGVENLTKTLAVEWARYGIRINSVAPGVIKSSGTNRYPPVMLEKAVEATPAGRIGAPDEVGWLILYMAHPSTGSFITGQTYYIDGGQSLTGHFQSDGWTKSNRAKL